jgi:hypothetical protein
MPSEHGHRLLSPFQIYPGRKAAAMQTTILRVMTRVSGLKKLYFQEGATNLKIHWYAQA